MKSELPGYYECPRHEVAELVSEASRRILDVGCGAGVLGAFLKERQGAVVWGVEYSSHAAAKASQRLDKVFVGGIEEHIDKLPASFFDTIICADVLEHLIDPWGVLARLGLLLAPGGELVASIPNVRHWSIIWSLLEGHWKYRDAGILDRTHLRFFTKESIIELFDTTGFQLLELYGTRLNAECRPSDELLSAMAASGIDVGTLREDSQHYQYLCRAVKRVDEQKDMPKPKPQKETDAQKAMRRRAAAVLDEAEKTSLRGEPEKAAKLILNQAIPQDPAWPEPYIRLVRILIKGGLIPEALGVLPQLPEGVDPVVRLELQAEALAEAGDDAAAASTLDELVRRAPGNATGHYLKGVLAHRSKDLTQAMECFSRALELDPETAQPSAALGLLRWSEGKREEGARLLFQAAQRAPSDRRIVPLALDAARTLGNWDQLLSLFSEAFKQIPDNRVVADALLEILTALGRREEALFHSLKMLGRFGVDDRLLQQAKALRAACPAPSVYTLPTSSLTVAMIVKNEEQNLPRCLASVLPLADEIVVVDTGSDDRTVSIAEAFGARVLQYRWNDDYAEARNIGLDAARGEWILILDADEALSEQDHPLVRQAIASGALAAWQVITRNYSDQSATEGWVPNNGRYPQEEAADGWYPSRKVRLFPRLPGVRFTGIVHEMLEQSLTDAGIPIRQADFVVHHYGELDQAAVIERKWRYYRLGKLRLEASPFDTELMARLAMQAGELGLAEEALLLWNRLLTHLPGHPEALFNRSHALISLHRYSEALQDAAEAHRQMPGHKESALNLAVAELHCGLTAQALSRVADLYAAHPAWPPLAALRLACAIISDDPATAADCYQQLKAGGHGVESYLGQLAETLATAGQPVVSQRLTAWIGDRRNSVVKFKPSPPATDE